MQAEKPIEKLDYKAAAVLLVIAVILGIGYSLLTGFNILFSIISLTIAVFASFYLLMSFFEEEKPVQLKEGEKMIVRTLDRGYIMFPGKMGGFMTKKTFRDLNIYLTSQRIIAARGNGEYVFEQPLASISKVLLEKRILGRYLRLRFLEKGKDKDVLLFVGSQGTDIWVQRLAELGITDTDKFESTSALESASDGNAPGVGKRGGWRKGL